jgi:hypothetical protein
MTLTPAYGRDYKSKKAVQADWDAGKDFIVCDMSSPWDGKPANKESLREAGLRQVMIRFDRLTKIQPFKV